MEINKSSWSRTSPLKRSSPLRTQDYSPNCVSALILRVDHSKIFAPTQDRLVQTQKLALLGQLTAGIAHEIKNPLNFVNNFSGISAELIDELQDTLRAHRSMKKPALKSRN